MGKSLTCLLVLLLSCTTLDGWDNYKDLFLKISKRGSGETFSFIVNSLWKGSHNLSSQLGHTHVAVCIKDLLLQEAEYHTQKDWALRMVDASSQFQSGFLDGNIVDLGNFKECIGIENKKNEFRGQYCRVVIYPDNEQAVPVITRFFNVQKAICVPSSCTESDVSYILQYGIDLTLQFGIYKCETKESLKPVWGNFEIIVMSVFGALVIVLLFATFYDVLMKDCWKKADEHVLLMNRRPNEEEVGKLKGSLLSFSMYSNYCTLMETDDRAKSIRCLHGLRFISACMILTIHRMILDPQPFTNSFIFDDEMRRWYRVIQMNAYLFVDLFFLMSGLLISYNFLKTEQRPKLKIFEFYIHRYIRLTPPVVACILLTFVMDSFCNGPYCNMGFRGVKEQCLENFLWTITYINNFYNNLNKCLIHSWYLSADMQLYWLAPLLLFPLKRWPRCIFIVLSLFLVSSITTTFLITYFKDLKAGYIGDQSFYEVDSTLVYEPFYTRAGPWIIGFSLGILLQSFNREEYKIGKMTVIMGWTLAIIFILVSYFGIYPFVQHDFIHKKVKDGIYKSTSRSMFALGFSWVIYACYTGYGGWLNRLLSSPVFHPLSKLSYCFYLIHPFAQFIQFSSVAMPRTYSDALQGSLLLGDICYSVVLAAILHLAVEAPALGLERVLRNWKETKNRGEEKNEITSRDKNSLYNM